MTTESESKYEANIAANVTGDVQYSVGQTLGAGSIAPSPVLLSPAPGEQLSIEQDHRQDHECLDAQVGEISVGEQPLYEEQPIAHTSLPLAVQDHIISEKKRLSFGDAPLTEDPYNPFDVRVILPLERARTRLLSLIVDHFIQYHLVPASIETIERSNEILKRRKIDDGEIQLEAISGVHYEGDPNYILPLLFVVNAYESLVSLVNGRISTITALQGKSIGLSLEAAGGLYRRLIEKYPKSGSITTFKRRELASADEARKRFPELVGADEKRVRFVVVHGLELVERPTTLTPEDAEWFRRVTGRPEAALYPSDYRFFSHRTKPRKSFTLSISPVQPSLMMSNVVNSLDKNNSLPYFQPRNSPSRSRSRSLSPSHSQPHVSASSQSQDHVRQPQPQLQSQYQPTPPQQQQQHSPHQYHETNGHHTPQQNLDLMNRLARQPVSRSCTIIRFCDECGTQFVRESSKFCAECGTKRYGM